MILHGDCLTVLRTLDVDSIDACVTDPPYGIGFMSKSWDTFSPAAAAARIMENDEIDSDNPNLRGRTRGVASSPSAIEYDRSVEGQRGFQAFCESWGREVFRVLKPGAYLLVCGAPRSYHRMACGIEDAGFEVRDCFAWLFGQGYPKSVDIARAIDMALCTEDGRHCMRRVPPSLKFQPGDHVCAETELGKQWAGWGSGLKPSNEPILVARKPLVGTLAENVLKFGAGALNIAACRLDSTVDDWSREKLARHKAARNEPSGTRRYIEKGSTDFGMLPGPRGGDELGRWPANVLLDQIAADLLDAQSGELTSGANPRRRSSDKFRDIFGAFHGQAECTPARGADAGGASRFYYVAKPSREERDLGCHDLIARPRDESRKEGNPGGDNPRNRGLQPRGNFHPTVKPVELMRWLVRLVTPPGGLVLDPFTGSGTTGMACVYEQRRFIGIEREADYIAIAERRIRSVAPLFVDEASA